MDPSSVKAVLDAFFEEAAAKHPYLKWPIRVVQTIADDIELHLATAAGAVEKLAPGQGALVAALATLVPPGSAQTQPVAAAPKP